MSGISVEHILVRNLSEHLATPVLLLDERGALIFFNEPAERLVGRPHDDLIEVGESWPALLHVVQNGHDADATAALEPLRTGSPALVALQLRVTDGVVETFRASSLPMVGHDGTQLGTVLTFWTV